MDSEIVEASAQRSRHGWNSWLLCAALAAVLAATLNISEKVPLNIASVEKWLVILCLSIYPVAGFAFNILKTYGSDLGERRIKLADPGSAEERLRFVIRAFFYVALGVAAYNGGDTVSPAAKYLAVGLFGVMIVSAMYGLTRHYGRTEIKKPQRLSVPMWLGVIGCLFAPLSALFLWLSWEYFSALSPIRTGQALPELRVATLLLVAAFIVQLLPVAMQRPTTLSALLRIRRDLFLKRLTTDEAWLQTEISVMGMNAPARREYYCRDLIEMHQAFQRSCDPVLTELQTLKAAIESAQGVPVTAVRVAELSKQLVAGERSVKKARKRLTKVEKYQTSRLSKMAEGETPEDVAEIDSAQDRLAPSYALLLQIGEMSPRLVVSAEEFIMSARGAIAALKQASSDSANPGVPSKATKPNGIAAND